MLTLIYIDGSNVVINPKEMTPMIFEKRGRTVSGSYNNVSSAFISVDANGDWIAGTSNEVAETFTWRYLED